MFDFLGKNTNSGNIDQNNNINKNIYENEIKELKEKLNKANKIIDQKNIEIQDLKNQINSLKNLSNNNQINDLKNEINIKNNQINELKKN